jgi:hypothetical protein
VTVFAPVAKAQEKVVEKIAAAEQPVITPAEKATIKRFDERVKEYVKVRAAVKAKAPKLSKDSTPEQIQAAENGLVVGIREARANAKQGGAGEGNEYSCHPKGELSLSRPKRICRNAGDFTVETPAAAERTKVSLR